MNADRISVRRFLVGAILFICGTAQLAAGIIFSLLLTAILRTASNIWTGTVNVVLGTILISNFNKRGAILVACLGTAILNSVNLFLLEFVEWKAFTSREGLQPHLNNNTNANIIVAAYYITTIPSIIILVIALLSGLCLGWTLAMKKRQLSHKQQNRMSLPADPSYFNWVFKESEFWQSNPNYYEGQTTDVNINQTQINNNNDIMETPIIETDKLFPPLSNSQMMTFSSKRHSGINDSSHTEQLGVSMPMPHSGKPSNFRYQPLSLTINHVHNSSWTPHADEDINPVILNRRSLLSKDETSLVKSPSNASHLRRAKSEVSNRPFTRHLTKINYANMYSTFETDTEPARRASPPRPFDCDSLVHLKRLELLARQWRFQAQHKALTRQFSFQISQRTQYSTNL